MGTYDIEQKLISYITASTRALPILSQLHGLELKAIDIQNALCQKLEIDDALPNLLLDKSLTEEQIIELLRDFNFKKFHPEFLTEIELEDGIIPEGTRRLLTEKTVKVRGEVWMVHKNDADPWPSNPHAHNYDAGLTLHLGTGDLFDTNRKLVSNIGKKKLAAVRNKLRSISLPPLNFD